ncbi:hypothetical protein BBJ28_00013243 [Nothophytophthora sp. Chile5]|nr:hypothetical protein BBJ28_00013243 [Nothophytophthora sp. Chile5]
MLEDPQSLETTSGNRKASGSHRVSTATDKRTASTHQQKKKLKTAKKPSSSINSVHAAAFTSGAVVPARCGYRTGKCQHLQAVKRNGKLHKLCEFHREKANMNQKKLDRKKRLQRSKYPSSSPYESFSSEDDTHSVDLDDSSSPRTIDESAVTASVFASVHLDVAPVLPTSLHEAPLALGCEELAIFCSLMTFDVSQRTALRLTPPPSHTGRPDMCQFYTSIV